MPARLCQYAIHIFLELLWSGLLESHEHVLTFMYLAYGIVSLLLLGTIQALQGTCIAPVVDLVTRRYRMTADDYRGWADRLAILARPISRTDTQQLHRQAKPLCNSIPFTSTLRIATTFSNSLLGLASNGKSQQGSHLSMHKGVPTAGGLFSTYSARGFLNRLGKVFPTFQALPSTLKLLALLLPHLRLALAEEDGGNSSAAQGSNSPGWVFPFIFFTNHRIH